MKNARGESLAVRLLDGELSEAEERAALHRIAEDPDARALLRFDLGLRRALADRSAGRVPVDFTDRVMAAIEEREVVARAASEAPSPGPRDTAALAGAGKRLAKLWEGLGRPRTLRWKPAHALVAAVALLLVVTAVFGLGVVPIGPAPVVVSGDGPGGGPEAATLAAGGEEGASAVSSSGDTVLVRFLLEAPDASSVAVAGDFTRWEPVALSRRWRDGEVLWTGILSVPRGEHRYMFVVDGSRWVTDPHASMVRDDGFGNRNAILSL